MRFLCLLLLGLSFSLPLAAQTYPTRSVEIVVPYGPGGTGDVIARQLAKKFEAHFGQPFVVQNKAGAIGTLGAGQVARAQPDGYSLLLGYTSEVAIVPWLISTAYRAQDLEPIVLAGVTPLLLVGTKRLPSENMRQLVTLLKSQPDGFSYASAGHGSPAHIAGELLNRELGTRLRHVPYRGGAQAVSDVLAGHTDIYFSGMPPAVPLVRSGELKAFAVTGAQRSGALPEVPTMPEAGLAGFDLTGWFALFLPKGAPPHIVEALRGASLAALSAPDVREALAQNGVDTPAMSREALAGFIASESEKYSKLIKELSIRAE